MTVLDEQGNERELKIGDLVKVTPGNGHILCGRYEVPFLGGCATVKIVGRGTCQDYEPAELRWLSSEPSDDSKEPTLERRCANFRANLRAARDKVLAAYSAEVNGAFDDYRLMERFVDFINYPHVHRWFWYAVAESSEDPRKVSYAARPEDVDTNARRRFCSVSRFIRGKGREYGLDFTDAEAIRIGELVGSHFPDSYEYHFEVVRGNDAVWRTYNDPEAGAARSCMAGSDYVRWYDDNPDKVGIVRIIQGNRFTGRALIWNTDQGVTVVDRVYPSNNGPHTNALHRWAEANGYDYKTRQSCGPGCLKSSRTDYTVTMVPPKNGTFPYLDTFIYSEDDPEDSETIKLNLKGGQFVFQCTGGGYEGGDREECNNCGCRVDTDECQMHDGAYYCDICFDEQFIELEYNRPNGQWVNRTAYRDDCCCCESCDEWRLSRDVESVVVRDRPRRGTRTAYWCGGCIENGAHQCDGCSDNFEGELITSTNDGTVYCESCFSDRCGTCDSCGGGFENEDLRECVGEIRCVECSKDYEDAIPLQVKAKQPEPPMQEARPASISPMPAQPLVDLDIWDGYRHNCPCAVCSNIAQFREAYYRANLGWVCGSENCAPCARNRYAMQEYIAAPYPNDVERQIIEQQRAREATASLPPAPEVDSPSQSEGISSPLPSTASNPYWYERVEQAMTTYAQPSEIMSGTLTLEDFERFRARNRELVVTSVDPLRSLVAVTFRPELLTPYCTPVIWDVREEDIRNDG